VCFCEQSNEPSGSVKSGEFIVHLNKEDICLNLHPEDGGSTILRNVGMLSQHYKLSQPRRPRLEESHSVTELVS